MENENKILDLESDAFKMRTNKANPYERDTDLNSIQNARMQTTTQCCIPEIIFTDFSNSTENNTGEYHIMITNIFNLEN